MAGFISTSAQGKLVSAFGRHVVSGNVVAKASTAVGTEVQTYAVVWLGEGIWSNTVAAYWNGALLDPSTYHFHRGELANSMDVATQRVDGTWTQGVDPWIQGGQTNSGTAYVVVKLPEGIKDGDDLGGLKFICDCLLLPDYDSLGRQIDKDGVLVPDGATPEDYFFYSTNPARAMAYLLLFVRGLANTRVDWTFWTAWKAFCDVEIPWVGGNAAGRPPYQNIAGMTEGVDARLFKSIASLAWDAGAATTSSIPSGVAGFYSAVIESAGIGIGLTNDTSPRNISDCQIGLYFNFSGDGVTVHDSDLDHGPVWLVYGATVVDTHFADWVTGDEFKLAVDEAGVISVLKNGTPLTLATQPTFSYPLYGGVVAYIGFVAGYTAQGEIRSAKMQPYEASITGERTRKRFECGLAFTDQTDMASVFSSILYVSCSTVQDNEGKLVFLPPPMASAPRAPEMELDESNILSFQTTRAPRMQKFTHFPARFRDLDSPSLEESTVEVPRDNLFDFLGHRNPAPEIFLGTMTKGQAECVMHYYARLSDLDVTSEIEADASTYPILPGSVVTVSESSVNWASVKMWVLSAVDRNISDSPDQRFFNLQQYTDNLYSDTDHTPLSSDVISTRASALEAPPVVLNVVLSERTTLLPDSTVSLSVRGVVTFDKFNGKEIGRLWIRRAEDEEPITTSSADNTITQTSHRYIEQTPIMFSGVSGAGFSNNTVYFTRNVTADTYQISATADGSIIDITADASGLAAAFVKTTDIIRPTGTRNQANFSINHVQQGEIKVVVVAENEFQTKSSFELHPVWTIAITAPPPAVTGLTGLRLTNDILTTWNHGEPAVFNPETYIIRVRNVSTNELMRIQTITIDEAAPAKWEYFAGSGDTGLVTINPDGSIYTTSSPTGFLSYNSQPFYGDADIEWEVDNRPFDSVAIGPYPIGSGVTGTFVENGHWFGSGDTQFIAAELASSLARRLAPKTKLKMTIRNQQVTYYLDDKFWMRSFQAPIPLGLRMYVSFLEDIPYPQAVLRLRITHPRQFIYTEQMQETDFGIGSVPGSVKIEVTQISGTGIESPVTYIIV